MARRIVSATSATLGQSFTTIAEGYRKLGEAVVIAALRDVAGERGKLGVPGEKIRRDAEAFFISERVWLFCALAGVDVESVRRRAWRLCRNRDRREGREAKGLRAALLAAEKRKAGGVLVRTKMHGIGDARS
jgi:hypothetical protein